ncbi:NADH-ubiquinone oxidoreductase chain 4L [Methanohalobium evestigatum Z-7303]|uniref:NADH-ubiquinone oxidoreductase chain 4L n=1 Tax=Methanohalobium evestigatum (strain ATCC BAA-1072 / DSM 3721 / NBRC 107634 / OCM 161 / Z-7303) TaxID=644295 RepID=D7E769_METEZ|nr:NADH-quinone oxidoreductase subunit K [Methanohalobium evestigatum]ADI73818.1 NADH-ubiquinone oxidoreductase chain 4L [Methanohalobium evestigatum Z-7303]
MSNVFLSLTIAILFGLGTFLILRKDVIKVIIGLSIISHAVNVFIVSSGVFNGDNAPIINGHGSDSSSNIIFNDVLDNDVLAPVVANTKEVVYVDPLVQALVLTAIVIGFSITAFILILAYRIYEEYGTTDITELKRLWG